MQMYMQLPVLASLTQSTSLAQDEYTVSLAHCSEHEQKCCTLHRLYATREEKGKFASLTTLPDIRLLL